MEQVLLCFILSIVWSVHFKICVYFLSVNHPLLIIAIIQYDYNQVF